MATIYSCLRSSRLVSRGRIYRPPDRVSLLVPIAAIIEQRKNLGSSYSSGKPVSKLHFGPLSLSQPKSFGQLEGPPFQSRSPVAEIYLLKASCMAPTDFFRGFFLAAAPPYFYSWLLEMDCGSSLSNERGSSDQETKGRPLRPPPRSWTSR